MADRVLRDELLTSERYWSVSIEAQRLFVHLLLNVDDLGRFSGKNYTIRAACFPGQTVVPDRLERMLSELQDVDLIRVYTVDGARYIFVPRFKQKLRYVNSKFPAPPEGMDDTAAEAIPDVTPKQWQRLRQEVLDRDGHQCLRCGETKRLSVDHITPRSLNGKSVVDNLVTLCVSCNSWKKTNPERTIEISNLFKEKYCSSSAPAIPEKGSSPLKLREVQRSKSFPPNPPLARGASADKSANPEKPSSSPKAPRTSRRSASRVTPVAWWRSEPGTLAKQRELGLIDYPGESWESLRSRIWAALNTKGAEQPE